MSQIENWKKELEKKMNSKRNQFVQRDIKVLKEKIRIAETTGSESGGKK